MKIIKNIDKKILITAIVLFAIGLIMIYSSSSVVAYVVNEASPSKYFIKELLFLIVGSLLSFVFLRFHSKTYGALSWLGIIIFTIALLLLYIYGTAINGATNWIGYGDLGIQPSEFIKVLLIPALAIYYDKNKNYKNDFKKMFLPLFIVLIIVFLIILSNDYGTAFIILLLSLLLFFLSPVSKKFKLITFLTFLCASIFLIISIVFDFGIIPNEKIERFNYFKPCERYITTGNQLCNSYIAINNGGLFGKGIGKSTQKYLYLPEAHTDFIFAIVIEELGIIGGIIILSLYFYLILKIIIVGKKSLKISHTLICYGIAIYIIIHILINLGGVLGLIPMTGIPLVFMSYGGSICWCTIFALTLVERISYETNIKLKEAH